MTEWHRAGGPRDDRGAALIMVLTLIILIAGITVAVTSILVAQAPAVYHAERSSQTVYAAQSGMQVALGQIRTAESAGFGDRSKLPCTITGAIDSEDDATTYEVSVRYYMDDPSDRPSSWRDNPANFRTCATLSATPYYALLTASGQGASVVGLADGDGDRTLQAVYTFRVSNVNIPGGRILNQAQTHCLSADSAGHDAKVRFRTLAQCVTDGEARTSWVYDTDYQIKLSSTLAGTPLCITGPVSGTATQDAVLRACQTNSTRWNQLWNWDGDYSWWGQKNPISAGRSGFCLAPTNSTATLTGQYLQVRSTGCSGQFSPSAEVGAGAASKATNQIVNYQEFGRCLDVTDVDINKAFMISYPCKQDASGAASFSWNHKWYYNEPPAGSAISADQQIIVKKDNTTDYCLQAPAAGASLGYPVFKPCSNSEPRQKWKRHGDTGSYSSSYLFTDTYGRCLAANPADVFNGWSKIVVTACSNSLLQKWNAPSQTSDSTLGSYREIG
ncbi:ricin-type beta-trefoil lectin domain protein [Salinibacterium sp. ZJ77]|uniref:ricin-type beta-trefoil lectin domain protein n=1 Tax=Salinibacterium sp. ZJ77 TaxID=2708337 RepID=UPI0014222A6D|nr:ricin-type beta-trefoil lectin domain protein [Salinibacterium sp. ZJ77]